ncbi:MAG: HAMP domain-containing protein [Clostridiales bacterium]|nr:HAMP domain-containing protein [Clostridiales bacterium]
MKNKLSIKARITLWYAALIVLICIASMFFLFGISMHAQMIYCRDTLESAMFVILDEMEIEHGIIEIDADIDEVPNVYAALFDPQGNLIYGRMRVEAPFEQGVTRKIQNSEHSWMILDERVDVPGHETIWVRLHMSADLSMGVAQTMIRMGLWMLPLLSVIALGGGYLLTRRALLPVKKMTQAAAAIADGNDLSQRSTLTGYDAGGDELHALAGTLEDMLFRLEASFDRERRFTSDAAHELRTPLSAMRTQGEYALSRDDMQEKDEAIVRMLEKNEEMRIMVDQLLVMARLDAGQTPMDEQVDLISLIESIVQDMEPVAQEKNMRIETALEDIHVHGNRAMLMRAVINLADNAIRYGREGGLVRISLSDENGEAVIRVTDDGEGLTEDALSHVFERFWRGDSARSTQGTGIGLAIVRATARAHGGSAQAQSAPGEGSEFSIRIPKK